MRAFKILWIVLLCPIALLGQQITGNVFDSDTKLPVVFATVYMNGTTIGCMTGSDGKFVLEYPKSAGKIVVSHVSYSTEIVNFNSLVDSIFAIALSPKIIKFEPILKTNSSRREVNLQYFKDRFLGTDTWGESAIIENDSVLFFKVEYFNSDNIESGNERKIKSLEVDAAAPIIISLPKLGYTLQYNLIKFSEKVDTKLNERLISILGYSYFQQMQVSSNLLKWEYRSNRLLAYYFSPQHFARSLYDNKLLENGYILFEYINDSKKLFSFDSCDCTFYISDELHISGMKNRKLYFYYFSANDAPVDLTRSGYYKDLQKSAVYFEEDTVIVRKDGSLPGGSLLFDNEIGIKRIGATLPSEYMPGTKVKNRKPMDNQKMREQLLKKIQL